LLENCLSGKIYKCVFFFLGMEPIKFFDIVFADFFSLADDVRLIEELSVSGDLCPESKAMNIHYDVDAHGPYSVPAEGYCSMLEFDMSSLSGFRPNESIYFGVGNTDGIDWGALRFDNKRLVAELGYPHASMRFDLGKEMVSGSYVAYVAPVYREEMAKVCSGLASERLNRGGKSSPYCPYYDKPSVEEGVKIFFNAVFNGKGVLKRDDRATVI